MLTYSSLGKCNILNRVYGGDAVFLRGTSEYINFTHGYWSARQSDVSPSCIFIPAAAFDVSTFVLLSRVTRCPFAAKSGGHATFAGASSIESGITISLAKLKGIRLSPDKRIASVGAGNLWGDVYRELAKSDVSVIGGRLYDIGVGGLTTGGGISYFSAQYGWACDNVESYDVVTASGVILQASASQHPDLYWALRGGGNNFGLVVNFNLNTISLPGGLMWGGTRTYLSDSFPAVEEAFEGVIEDTPQDPGAGLWLLFAAVGGIEIAAPALYHLQPNAGNATIWSKFNEIPATDDTTRTRVLADWAEETTTGSPGGLRQIYYPISVKADLGILRFARELFFETVVSVTDVSGILPLIAAQGITTPLLQQMRKNGGNALGLDEANGPLYIIHMGATWENIEDDSTIFQWMTTVLRGITAEAKVRGLHSDFIYMNYANQFQDVISSYGAANKDRLKTIASRYDPTRVFQDLQPGYFKLDHGPIPNPTGFNR
ncbi:FAD-binding domain-containing protein [Thozetella sp. PMI_491]|nr:FAD-binding domain-containing protein [Thozetella sp. PMI_491]